MSDATKSTVAPISSGRILVTGASRGIGRAVAEALGRRGAKLALLGRDADALLVTARKAPRHAATVLVGDLANPSEREGVVPRAVEALGGLDGIVHCAGVLHYEEIGGLSADALRAQIEVNYLAPVLLLQQAQKALRQSYFESERPASVVLVGSSVASRPAPGLLGYGASKAALHNAARVLAAELAPHIRVNVLAPGVVDTDMIRAPRLKPGEEAPLGTALRERVDAQVAALSALHPLGLGDAAQVADAALYLLDAGWATGSELTLDGGLTAL